MTSVDWILLALWLFGAAKGWRMGLVRQLVSITGILAGLLLAKGCYAALGGVLSPHVGGGRALADALAFILIWIAVPMALGLAGELVTTVLDKLLIVGKLNKLLGAAAGLVKYSFVLGAVVWALSLTGALGEATVRESALCGPLRQVPVAAWRALAPDAEEGEEAE